MWRAADAGGRLILRLWRRLVLGLRRAAEVAGATASAAAEMAADAGRRRLRRRLMRTVDATGSCCGRLWRTADAAGAMHHGSQPDLENTGLLDSIIF